MLPDKDTAIYTCKCGEKVKIENEGTSTKYNSFDTRCILVDRSCERCGEALELQGVIPSKNTVEIFYKDR